MAEATEGDHGAEARLIVRIRNKRGLHARASARFVECASAFDAEIRVSREGLTVPGTSIMGLMMLAAEQGAELALAASGPQAGAALSALAALIEARFNEE